MRTTKLLKESKLPFLHPTREMAAKVHFYGLKRAVHLMKSSFNGWSSTLVENEETYLVPNLHRYFSGNEISKPLNTLHLSDFLQGMLKGEDCHRLDMNFPSVSAILDKWISALKCQNPRVIIVGSLYSGLLHEVCVGSKMRLLTENEVQLLI